MRIAQRLEPKIMAHADIMVDCPAIAQGKNLPYQTRGRLVISIIISRRHFQIMFGDHHIAHIQHHARAIAADFAQFDPAFCRGTQTAGLSCIAWRNKRDEHPVNVAREHRVALLWQ